MKKRDIAHFSKNGAETPFAERFVYILVKLKRLCVQSIAARHGLDAAPRQFHVRSYRR